MCSTKYICISVVNSTFHSLILFNCFIRSKMKVIKMLLLVVVLFAMSWLPLYAILTRVKFGPPPSDWEDQLIRTIIPMAQCLGSSNSCINPILYAFFNKKYRTGFKVSCGMPHSIFFGFGRRNQST